MVYSFKSGIWVVSCKCHWRFGDFTPRFHFKAFNQLIVFFNQVYFLFVVGAPEVLICAQAVVLYSLEAFTYDKILPQSTTFLVGAFFKCFEIIEQCISDAIAIELPLR